MCIQDRIVRYLEVQVRSGPRYFKAKWIGLDLGLSSKQVGSNLLVLTTKDVGLKIEQHSHGVGCATWRVEAI